ncbi:MAG: EF-hand domain-containing protein [Sulfitobacter sp.]
MKSIPTLTLIITVVLGGCTAAFCSNAAFKELDTNGNGQLTPLEFEPLFNDPDTTHDPATPEAIAGLFKQADSNADGLVSAGEFDTFAKSRE